MKGVPYQQTIAGRGSQLFQALFEGRSKEARTVYDDTTQRFDALYPPGHRAWFENWRSQ